MASSKTLHSLGFGGGCHWCTEAVFLILKGVCKVEQGYIASEEPYNAYSEGVLLHYDPEQITLGDLLRVHLSTHSSRSEHQLRHKYRSAVYFLQPDEKTVIQKELVRLKPHITKALLLKDFRPSPERYHSYFRRYADKPFTDCHIRPKLLLLSRNFPHLMTRSALFHQRLQTFPEGYSERIFRGESYGVTKRTFNRGRSLKLYAEHLGGRDYVSCNLYITSRTELIKPCEMEMEKVLEFVFDSTPLRRGGDSPLILPDTQTGGPSYRS